MKEDDIYLDDDIKKLWRQLKTLHAKQRDFTRKKYDRVNPFAEDLFEWEEKGRLYGCKNTRIYDSATIIGDVKLGDNVWIGPSCIVDGSGGLSIGDNCDISAGVKIFSHDTVRRALSGGKLKTEHAPVSIGKNCFIGTDSIILKGTSIGDRCLVAANSTVSGKFPDDSIIAGVPARKIGKVVSGKKGIEFRYDKGKKK
jgi:acetyltransferase-like isoleucine patch superfamily enzyme